MQNLSYIAFLLFLVSFVFIAEGTTYPVKTNNPNVWVIGIYPDLTINTNDGLTFIYPPDHHVSLLYTLMDYNTCNLTRNITDLANETMGGGAGFTHKFTAAGTYYVVCSKDDHCLQGQKFMVTVSDSQAAPQNVTVHVDPDYPSWITSTYDNITLSEGDKLYFLFSRLESDVTMVPDGASWDACDPGSATSQDDTGNYTWTASAPGTYYFISSQEGCVSDGQKLVVTVRSTPTAPTPETPTHTPMVPQSEVPAPLVPTAPTAPTSPPTAPVTPPHAPTKAPSGNSKLAWNIVIVLLGVVMLAF